MPIMIQSSKVRLMCGSQQIAKMYCEGDVIYSVGNIVTYVVDTGVTYQERVDEGMDVLSPSSFKVPAKSGYTYLGWSLSQNGQVVTSLAMRDNPITLYAVYMPNTLTVFQKSSATAAPSIYNTSYVSVAMTQWYTANGFTRGYIDSFGGTNDASGTITIKTLGAYKRCTITLNSASSGEGHFSLYHNGNGAGILRSGFNPYSRTLNAGDVLKIETNVADGEIGAWLSSIVLEL